MSVAEGREEVDLVFLGEVLLVDQRSVGDERLYSVVDGRIHADVDSSEDITMKLLLLVRG